MNRLHLAIAAVLASSVAPAAAETPGADAGAEFLGWRVSAGGSVGFGLKTKLGFRAPRSVYSGPTSPAVGSPADIASRLESGGRVGFLGGAYIDPDGGEMASPYTQNWRLPVSSLNRDTGKVTLDSVQMSDRGISGRGSDDDTAFGANIELSRTVYAHESGFGLDLAAGFSWMRRNNCFKASSSGTYADNSRYVYTPTPGSMNQAVLSSPVLSPSGGYYGAGSNTGMGPVLDWSDFGPATISQTGGTGQYSIDASGDYEEWALSLMLKPWWEMTDWWRLTGTIGAGFSRSEFDATVSATFGESGKYGSREKFHDWQCYGIGGVGTVFRLWRMDLSFDVLARFCQDDMKIHSETLSGKIEKPNVVLCVALGFDF